MEQANNSEKGNSTPDLSIDIRKWAYKILSFWWLFMICLLISVPSAYLYLRYANYEYVTKAKVLIKGAGKGGSLSEIAILGESLGISSGGKDLNNEIEVFSSRPILTQTVERIGAEVTYHRIGKFKNTELFNSAPFTIESYTLSENRNRASFFIEIGYYDEFIFKRNQDEKGETHTFGKAFENEFGKFLIVSSPESKLVPGLYAVNILVAENVAESYKRKLAIEVVGAQNSSSILEFELQDQSPDKSVAFLNTLIETYNESQISDNTFILENTIRFIDNRIEVLESELDDIEQDIEDFKSRNSIITSDVNSSLGFVLPELRSAINQLATYEINKELLLSVSKDLKSANENDQLIPANVANASPELGSLINQYNLSILQKRRLQKNITSASPVLANLETEIEDYEKLILVSLENIIANMEIPMKSTQKEIERLKVDITKLPAVEKQLLEKIRMQILKEGLYLHLLERKEETQLSMAVTTANTRVIESAKSSRGPVYPQTKLIRLGAVLLGFFVPLIIIFILALLDNKIDSENTLASLTSIPIIGRIPRIKKSEKVVVEKLSNTVTTESFRLLRTNLSYMNLENDKQILMTTSSTSGEGKTVVSINLAMTIAHAGKKAVLVDLDLRKPKVATYLQGGMGLGVSSYLAGQSELNAILNPHSSVENFSFITSGAIPPNPAEMLQSDRMNKLLELLKKEFDFIILDCPPMGLVADALLLRKYVTNTLYVVRHRFTKKLMIKQLDALDQKGELTKPSLVLNDLKMSRAEYGYGGYKSGYYTDE